MQQHPPPAHLPPVTAAPQEPASQQFYDFQWRVLTLCSEFYNAADELIVSFILITDRRDLIYQKRGAPPHVVSQCFSLPGNHVDPISILNDARRACDTLVRASISCYIILMIHSCRWLIQVKLSSNQILLNPSKLTLHQHLLPR